MSAVIEQYFAGLSKSTFLLAFASLFADISTEMLYPVLPVFLTQTLQANGSIVGFIDGLAQATQNIVQVFRVHSRTSCRKGSPSLLPAISSRQLQSRSWVSRTLGKGCSRRAF
jgi:hypothetical protein